MSQLATWKDRFIKRGVIEQKNGTSTATDPSAKTKPDPALAKAYEKKYLETERFYRLAIRQDKKLKKGMQAANRLADRQEYEEGIAALEKLQTECLARLEDALADQQAELQPIYDEAVALDSKLKALHDQAIKLGREKKFLEASDTFDRLYHKCQETNKQAVRDWRTAESNAGTEIRYVRNLQASPDPTIAAQGNGLVEMFDEAQADAQRGEYYVAIDKLKNMAAMAKSLIKDANDLKDAMRKETEQAAAAEQAAFEFATKVDDKKWGFNTNEDAINFMLGMTTGAGGGAVKSEKLKDMEKVISAAIERKNKLVESGVNPVEAGELAFKNIPRNFWPPSVVREMAMFERARAQIEAEETAEGIKQETKDPTVSEMYNKQLDYAKKGSKYGLKIAKTGTSALKKAGQLSDDDAEKAGEEIGGFFGGFNAVLQVGSALGSGIEVAEKEIERREEKWDPVRDKILEFERNRAIVAMLNNLTDAALSSIDLVLKAVDINVVGGIKDLKAMVIAAQEAVRYFGMLMETKDIQKGAKADPETMMHLSLKQRMKTMKVDCSKKTFTACEKFVNAVGKFAGDAAKGTPAAAAAPVISHGGKALTFAGNTVFKMKDAYDKHKVKQALDAAKKKPVDYKAVQEVFERSTAYARFSIAYAAVEEKDPWAISYITTRGLKEADLDHPATSVAIVREYLMVTYEGVTGKTQQDTKAKKPGAVDKAKDKLKSVSVKGRDKLIGRDTGIPYNKSWHPNVVGLTVKQWHVTKEQAVAAGWYDDRGGHGTAFKSFENHWDELQEQVPYTGTGKNVQLVTTEIDEDEKAKIQKYTADALAAASLLKKEVRSIPVLANDRKTEHAGMKDYTTKLYQLIIEKEDEIWALREDAADLQLEAEGKTREEVLQEAIEAQEALTAKADQFREDEITKAWKKHKLKTPYGSHTLDKFPAEATKKLGLDERSAAAIEDDVEALSEGSLVSLLEMMSGWGDIQSDKVDRKQFDKELKRQIAYLDKQIFQLLRDFCGTQYVQTQGRLADQGGKTGKEFKYTAGSDLLKLESKAWEDVKKNFEKDGWKRYPTGIRSALKDWLKADEDWKTMKYDVRFQGLWRASFSVLSEKFGKLDPVTTKGFSHPGFVRYKNAMLKRLDNEYKAFKADCDATPPPKGDTPAGWVPDHPHTIAFTERGWKGMKDAASEHDWDGKHPDIGKAFAAYEKASRKWNDSTYKFSDEDVTEEDVIKLRSAVKVSLDKLRKEFGKFDPMNTKKRPHAGMFVYRREMLKKANDLEELVMKSDPTCLLPGL